MLISKSQLLHRQQHPPSILRQLGRYESILSAFGALDVCVEVRDQAIEGIFSREQVGLGDCPLLCPSNYILDDLNRRGYVLTDLDQALDNTDALEDQAHNCCDIHSLAPDLDVVSCRLGLDGRDDIGQGVEDEDGVDLVIGPDELAKLDEVGWNLPSVDLDCTDLILTGSVDKAL